MTGFILHGLVWKDTPMQSDAPDHVQVEAGDLSAIASCATPGLLDAVDEPPVAEARLHHELLSAYAAGFDVLPVRFASVFSSRAAMAAALQSRHRALRNGLHYLSDRVEYVLSLSASGEGRAAPFAGLKKEVVTGRAFLAHKRDARDSARSRSARRERFASEAAHEVGTAVADCRVISPSRPGVLLSCALLVDRASDSRMMEKARDIARRGAALGLGTSLRGPGPCYAFADESEQAPDVEPAEVAQFNGMRDGG